MSTATSAPALKYVHIESKGAYAIATINREPVNGMDLDLWSELLTTLTTLENDKKCRGVIFQSGLKRDVFTAGNDIKELYSKTTTEQRFHQFWRAQTFFLSRLYRSRLVTIASIRGQCPAGGCVMALACDYRVMNVENDPRIGLNEVALGISVPPYWITLFTQLTGFAVADRLLQTGAQVTSTEAVQLGLINKVVTKDQLLSTAESEMKARLKFPDSGRIQTKLSLRGEVSRKWEAFADQEATEGWKGLSSPGTTAALGAVLARLSAPTDKPKSKL